MGLLDILNNPEMQMGMGLLAAGGPTSDPNQTGFGQRMTNAMSYAQNMKKEQAKMEFQQMQMEEARVKVAQEKQMRELAARFQTPAQPGLAPLMGDAESGILPSKGSPAVPAGFDYAGYAGALSAIDPLAALKLQQSMQPKYETVAPGSSVYKYGATGPTLAMTAPDKAEKDDSKIVQYKYARENGYKGSFEQFVTLGPTITAGALAGLRDAQIGNINAENDYNLPPPRRAASGGVSVTANGRVFIFPDQKSANNFKLKAGVK